MGITLSVLQRLAAPLHTFVGWMSGASGAHAMGVRPGSPVVHLAPTRTCPAWSTLHRTRRDSPRHALRVVRVVDASPAPLGAGRMIISGRMADVCAELDRLAALEAANQ